MSDISGCNISTGCKAFVDHVYTGKGSAPFSAGDFTWAIAWLYALQDDLDPAINGQTQFTTATHYQEADSAGSASIQKKGAGPFTRAINDTDNCPAD